MKNFMPFQKEDKNILHNILLKVKRRDRESILNINSS